MKKFILLSLASLLTLAGCSDQADKLIGSWVSSNGNSSITIKRGQLYFNYAISTSTAPAYLAETCRSIVIFSNNGFNCFKFPNKTARLVFQPGLSPKSDSLISDNIYSSDDEIYHREP